MKLARVEYQGESVVCLVKDEGLVPVGIGDVIKYSEKTFETNLLKLHEVTFLPPIENPSKILCVGTNYKKHILETHSEMPTVPVIFSKFNSALAGHNCIVNPPKMTKKLDYEAELVLIIGKDCRNVSEDEALDCLFGVTCGNDVSARDLQKRTSQWLVGKTPDGFAPVGPYVVTADSIDPQHLEISCRLNGELRQHSNTSDMIFSCACIISYLSKIFMLHKGDMIFTGTPDGVILGMEDPVWLQKGDVAEVTIEGIGTLCCTIGDSI